MPQDKNENDKNKNFKAVFCSFLMKNLNFDKTERNGKKTEKMDLGL